MMPVVRKRSHRQAPWPRDSVRRMVRKRDVFYFRRIFTEPLTGEITLSLGTKSFREAQRLAWTLEDLCAAALCAPEMTLGDLKERLRECIRRHVAGEALASLHSWPAVSVNAPVGQHSAQQLSLIVSGPRVSSMPGLEGHSPRLASELCEPFHSWRIGRGLKAQTCHQDRTTLRLFLEIAGDLPVSTYTRRHISDFIATLRRLPRTYGKSTGDKARSVEDLIAVADFNSAPRLSERTLERHCNVIRQFLRFAYDQAEIAKEQLSIAEGFSFKAAMARTQRKQWEDEELIKLFSSPIWSGMKGRDRRSVPGPVIERDAYFWLPLLGIYHGNRLEECAQLLRGDIRQADDIWCMRITDEGEGQQLKNEPSRRVVPIHPILLRMGFIDYVRSVAPAENDPIFPDLPPSGPDKKRGFMFTKRFSWYRQKIGVKKGRDYHSFRHNVTTQLLNNGIPQHLVDQITGHVSAGETVGRYYKGAPIKLLADAIGTIQWPMDFSHLMKP